MITIVYPPTIDYNFLYQRPQQLMKAFAELGCNVVYVNPANYAPQNERVVTPFGHLPNFKVVRQDTDIRQFLKGKVVVWNSWGGTIDYSRNLNADLVVFDSLDKATDEFASNARLIPAMEEHADIIFTTAIDLYDDHKKREDRVFMLPNGADYHHFTKALNRIGDRPPEYPNSDVIIGYYGALASWIDIQFVNHIANKYNVVMIGKNRWFNQGMGHQRIKELPAVPYDKLPYYLSWMDVCIIPFRLTEMIAGCDPIKCYEYLSAGKPVVATQMKELGKFGDAVYTTTTPNAIATIDKALEENSDALVNSRMNIAKENSWYSRASTALNIIKEGLGVS